MRYLLCSFFTLINSIGIAQLDNVGSGRAIQFNGTDGYVNFGDIYNNLTQPFTISAWVYVDPTSSVNPIFCTNDNPTVYKGFIFFVAPSAIGCEFGDGTGGNNPAYRRGKIAYIQTPLSRWIHVCAVMTAPFDIHLYINGIDVGGSSSGESNLPMAASAIGDVAKSGYYISNSTTYRSKGMLDELRIWNRSLTQTEVQQGMCMKLKGNESGLIGYWNFDETVGSTVYDYSPNSLNGQLINNPARVFSGAPIGDDSKYQYSTNWIGSTFNFQANNDLVSVNNIQGSPEGIHIYEVKQAPSQTGGLDANAVSQPYFGVYAASLDVNNSFDLTYNYQGSTSCKMFSRTDNSVPTWSNSNNPFTAVPNRVEVIRSNIGQNAAFDLGPDKILCNQSSTSLSTGITDPQFTILWNTGESTPSINVTQSGEYSVRVSSLCGEIKDSVKIQFEPIPTTFDLGSDRILCNQSSTILSTGVTNPQISILWNTGETSSSINVAQSGKWVVKVYNDCGMIKDSVNIKFEPIPSTFDLGPDKILCNQSSTTLSTGVTNPLISILWNTGETSSSINVTQSGKWVVKVYNDCGIIKDSVNIKFEPIPPPISFGDDQTLCVFKPIALNAVASSAGYQIKWQDGSNGISFQANDFGKYWVTVTNDCGLTSDTVTFSKYKQLTGLIPNVITPNNGDTLNQYFKIDDTLKGKVSLLVLNRWGKEVYKSNSYENDWDGGGLSPGVYYIVLSGPCMEEVRDCLTIIH